MLNYFKLNDINNENIEFDYRVEEHSRNFIDKNSSMDELNFKTIKILYKTKKMKIT